MCAYRAVATPNFLLTHTHSPPRGTCREADTACVTAAVEALFSSERVIYNLLKGSKFDVRLINHANTR